MEAFSLLKYWRGGGAAGSGTSTGLLLAPSSDSTTATTISTTTVPQNENATETTDDDEDEDDGDNGPFFDLEFTVPDEVETSEEDGQQNPHPEEEEEECDGGEGEGEFKFTISPNSSNDRGDSVSPSGDLFFKGKLVEVETSSAETTANKPQFTASLLKSATKFRVFMSGLKKPKPDSVAPNPEPQHKRQNQQQRVKFKVEEVPIVSLFTRDNSSRVNKPQPQSQNEAEEPPPLSSSEEKRFSKEVVMQKYLKMVKPLYVRVSRRYGDKLAAAEGEAVTENVVGKGQKQGNLPARLRVVCKHLGKSRSASSAVAASPPAAVSSKRRDDSLLQQQDAIQGAILHCKKSFNASRGSGCESSQLPRSVSDPLHDEVSRISTTEGKDKRVPLKKEEK